MDPLSLISGGTQLLGTVAGLWGSANDQKKFDRKYNELITGRENDITSLFNKEYSKDFLQTDVAKSAVKDISENYQNTLKNNEKNVVKGGGTTESQLASRESANDTYNDALSKLTSYGTQYRDSLRQNYEAQMGQMFNVKANALQQQNAQNQQKWANIQGNAAGLGGSLAGLFGGGEAASGSTFNANWQPPTSLNLNK
jgi:hypothetical protein